MYLIMDKEKVKVASAFVSGRMSMRMTRKEIELCHLKESTLTTFI